MSGVIHPKIIQFLNERGICPLIAERIGVTYVDGWISYPRYNREGLKVGHKRRHIDTGKVTQEPSGIPGKDIMMLSYIHNPHGIAYLCEGETDFMMMSCLVHDGEVPDGAAYCVPGSHAFTPEHANEVNPNYEVVVIPDGDAAGNKMLRRIARHIPDMKYAHMPDGHDLCSYVNVYGSESFAELIADRTYPNLLVTSEPRSRGFSVNEPDWPDGALEMLIEQTVRLTPRGGELACKCPFHEDRTASMMVSRRKQVAYCHGCGWTGGATKWIMETEGKTFRDARAVLEQRYGHRGTETLW